MELDVTEAGKEKRAHAPCVKLPQDLADLMMVLSLDGLNTALARLELLGHGLLGCDVVVAKAR